MQDPGEDDPVLARMREDLRRSDATIDMVHGAVVAGVGIVVTLATYSMAAGGGVYVVAWGAILFGAVRFFKGLANRIG